MAVAGILLGAGVLGHLGHGMLSQQEPESCLYLPGGNGAHLVVVGEPAVLGGNPLEPDH